MRPNCVSSTLLLLAVAALACHAQKSIPQTTRSGAYSQLPLTFEANMGQTDAQVNFLTRGRGYSAFLTTGGLVLSLRPTEIVGNPKAGKATEEGKFQFPATLQFRLAGGNQNSIVVGEDPQPGRINYFIGNNPARWHTDVPTFGRIRSKNVYPGIDLVYYGNHRQLEYDFEVSPSGDPNRIQFEVVGAGQINIDLDGDLVLQTRGGDLHFKSPVVYQESNGERISVDGKYVLRDSTHVAFSVAHYDANKPLVIDPVLVYSTYLGGSGVDQPMGIAVDATGSVYVAGYTNSVDFPLAVLGTLPGNANHVFVAKLDPSGSNLVYADYIGGSSEDYAASLVLDKSNNVYLTGSTQSADFPVVKPYQAQRPGPYTGFVTKVSADGASLLYSTYLGGNAFDQPASIAIDGLADVYVAGTTMSLNFPVAAAYQSSASANEAGLYGYYGFLTKFSPDGSSLAYSTYLAGNSNVAQDCGNGPCWPVPYNSMTAVAVDANGNAYVTGTTNTYNFPATAGTYLTSNSTQQDATVGVLTKFSNTGSLDYSTYFYGSSGNPVYPNAIKVDGSGSAYVTGVAQSDGTFPITSIGICDPGVYGYACSYAFVTKFDPTGSTLLYSTFLGPNNYAAPQAIALDTAGDAYVLSSTPSNLFQTNNAIESYAGKTDLLLVEIDPAASTQLFATYLGGSTNDSASGMALDSLGNIYVAGASDSTDFPVTQGSFQARLGGTIDAFVAKIGSSSAPSVSLTPSSLQFSSQLVGSSSQPQQVLVRNMGSSPLTVSSISVVGDFAETSNCGASLPASGSCVLSVTFAPTANGSRTGSIVISDDAAGSPHLIGLSGSGLAAVVALNPASLSFPSVQVGTSSTAQTVTLSNTGGVTLNISSIQATGDYTQTNNCGARLPASGSCILSVTFAPTASGSRTGSIVISDDAPGSPHLIGLSGSGLAAVIALNPATLSFPSTQVGTSSIAQTVNLSNTGNATLSVNSLQVTGDYTQTNNCPASLSASSTCFITVTFTPTSSGTRNGSVVVNDNAHGSPHTVALAGIGSDFSLSSSPASATVKAGATVTYTLSVVPVGGAFSNTINLGCSGAPAKAACTLSPSALAPGSSPARATLTITTSGSSAQSTELAPPRAVRNPVYAAWLQLPSVGILGLLLAAPKRQTKKCVAVILLALAIAALLGMSACAGGTGISQAQSGTIPGTYTITVTGTSGSLQHSLPLTLTVQ